MHGEHNVKYKISWNRSIMKGTYMKSNVPTQLYLGFRWRDIPENTHPGIQAHPPDKC